MRKIVIEFYECEHYGDLDNYMDDIRTCGGSIESHTVDVDSEIGTVECTVPDDFWRKFQTTYAYEFVN